MAAKIKKPFYKKWWVWLFAIIVVFAIAGGGEEETAKKVDGNTTKSTETKDKKEAQEKEVFTVGEKVQLGDNVLTVTNVKKSNGDEFDKPKNGHEYVTVTVEISNAGKENISYNPFDFKMSNSQGQIVDQAFTIVDTDTALQSGELSSNGKVSGTITFEQPANDKGLQLQYEPSFWSDKIIKVNL